MSFLQFISFIADVIAILGIPYVGYRMSINSKQKNRGPVQNIANVENLNVNDSFKQK